MAEVLKVRYHERLRMINSRDWERLAGPVTARNQFHEEKEILGPWQTILKDPGTYIMTKALDPQVQANGYGVTASDIDLVHTDGGNIISKFKVVSTWTNINGVWVAVNDYITLRDQPSQNAANRNDAVVEDQYVTMNQYISMSGGTASPSAKDNKVPNNQYLNMSAIRDDEVVEGQYITLNHPAVSLSVKDYGLPRDQSLNVSGAATSPSTKDTGLPKDQSLNVSGADPSPSTKDKGVPRGQSLNRSAAAPRMHIRDHGPPRGQTLKMSETATSPSTKDNRVSIGPYLDMNRGARNTRNKFKNHMYEEVDDESPSTKDDKVQTASKPSTKDNEVPKASNPSTKDNEVPKASNPSTKDNEVPKASNPSTKDDEVSISKIKQKKGNTLKKLIKYVRSPSSESQSSISSPVDPATGNDAKPSVSSPVTPPVMKPKQDFKSKLPWRRTQSTAPQHPQERFSRASSLANLTDIPEDIGTLTVIEVAHLLQTLKLEKYAEDFRYNEIDGLFLKEDMDETMLSETFGMSKFESKRLMRFVHGKRPKRE